MPEVAAKLSVLPPEVLVAAAAGGGGERDGGGGGMRKSRSVEKLQVCGSRLSVLQLIARRAICVVSASDAA